MRPGRGAGGLSLQGLLARGQEFRFHPVGHGELLGGLEVICILRMPKAIMDSGLGRKQMETGRLLLLPFEV